MQGLMQDWPLLVHKIIDHAARYHGEREVVSRSIEGSIVRSNYHDIALRARRVAHALQRQGFQLGDRVATLAWNTARHIETWHRVVCRNGCISQASHRASKRSVSLETLRDAIKNDPTLRVEMRLDRSR
jgi:acyl-CoA synthetase (AMP-forming)/AMP-acid ligase II